MTHFFHSAVSFYHSKIMDYVYMKADFTSRLQGKFNIHSLYERNAAFTQKLKGTIVGGEICWFGNKMGIITTEQTPVYEHIYYNPPFHRNIILPVLHFK